MLTTLVIAVVVMVVLALAIGAGRYGRPGAGEIRQRRQRQARTADRTPTSFVRGADLATQLGAWRDAGLIATLSQLGYALGILLVVPLGDRNEPRSLVRILLIGVAAALAAAGRRTDPP